MLEQTGAVAMGVVAGWVASGHRPSIRNILLSALAPLATVGIIVATLSPAAGARFLAAFVVVCVVRIVLLAVARRQPDQTWR